MDGRGDDHPRSEGEGLPAASDAATDEYPAVPDHLPSSSAVAFMPLSLVLTDPTLPDNPIVYVNRSFVRITGYAPEAVIGRNCRFLQRDDRDQPGVKELAEAIGRGEECVVDLVNYRANGERFLNRLMVTPLRRQDGKITHFLGVQMENRGRKSNAERVIELDERLREVQHRVKNHLSMILSMVRLEARNKQDPEEAISVLAKRVEAIGLLYEHISDRSVAGSDEAEQVALGAYVSRVSSAMQLLSDHRRVRINVEADEVMADQDTASRIGLILSELLTNALQHAFETDGSGEIKVQLANDGSNVSLSVADNGRGLTNTDWPDGSSLGGKIVLDLAKRLGGELTVSEGLEGRGTRIHIEMSI